MNNYFGVNLKYLRLKNKLKQSVIAGWVKKDLSLIGKWESGERTPLTMDAMLIAERLGVPFDDMILKDLRFEDQVKTINDSIGDEKFTIPRDCGVWHAGDVVSVNEMIDYIDEIKNKNDRLKAIEKILKGDD